MKNREIFRLIEKFEAADISLLEYEDSEGRLRLEKGGLTAVTQGGAANNANNEGMSQNGAVQGAAKTVVDVRREVADPESGDTEENGTLKIKAPLVGVFYRASAPDSEPFAEIGKEIKEGEPLCIIEAMKVMNEIKAPYDLIVKNIMGVDGEMVDFGMEIFEVEKC